MEQLRFDPGCAGIVVPDRDWEARLLAEHDAEQDAADVLMPHRCLRGRRLMRRGIDPLIHEVPCLPVRLRRAPL